MFDLLKNLMKKRKAGEDAGGNAKNDPLPEKGGVEIDKAQVLARSGERRDSFGVSEPRGDGLLAVLAEGERNANGSEAAVKAALSSFRTEKGDYSDEATLLRILARAREAVQGRSQTDDGTTFLAALIRNRQLHFLSVGRIRLYLLRSGDLVQLNRDYVYGREIDKLTLGEVLKRGEAERERQHAAMGSRLESAGALNIDRNVSPVWLYPGDKLALLSDGVFDSLTEEELTALLNRSPRNAAEAVKEAVLAKSLPQQDNLTVIVLEIIETARG